MIPVLTAQNFRELDNRTCELQGISELELMERAAAGCNKFIRSKVLKSQKIAVLCGRGNNGGDGIAIGRLLRESGFEVDIFCVSGSRSHACEEQAQKTGNLQELNDFTFDRYEVIIDALFGTGISRPVDGEIKSVIEQLNQSQAFVISIDIPSGLSCDRAVDGEKVRAAITCVIGAYKLTQFLPDTADFYGEIQFVSIYPENLLSQYNNVLVMDYDGIQSLVIPRRKFSHKGSYGHALLVAGSMGKAGAAILSARACVRSGVGLLTVETPMSCLLPLQVAVPEAMVLVNGSNILFSTIETGNYTAIGMGPGVTTDKKVSELLCHLFQNELPKVIDADGLNILAESGVNARNAVLTPHPKEFSRLTGKEWTNSFERYELAKAFALETGNVLVLKDAVTMIFAPDGRVAVNSTGNPGMATGGMGDTLTGMILALIAQHYSLWDAARIAVFHHGLAGDRVASERGEAALLPSDVIEALSLDKIQSI